MSDGRVAAVHLARSRAIDGALYVVTDAAAPAPFVVVPTAGAEAVLRARVRAGDSVVAVADFPGRDRILRRASAWGANAIWVGESSRPDDGLATVCVPGDPRELLADWAESAPRLAADPLAIAPAIVGVANWADCHYRSAPTRCASPAATRAASARWSPPPRGCSSRRGCARPMALKTST
ncbi:hypothetical protein [uncultured Microbacterium sp.]|uniref:hypothetical protein n=1 Tax=uncultured Microbacterium sp. TaxID=191216 RepID=UPI00258A5768|nr:hypothetical protein [uncultured Microbacterium sp.]